jgi:DNA (cytosine-5)-methyltransferase 1
MLPEQRVRSIDHWNALLKELPHNLRLPSFPIWGDEIYARYTFATKTPFALSGTDLLLALRRNGSWYGKTKTEILELLPSYARTPDDEFPHWKKKFIQQNRQWFRLIQPYFPDKWVRQLRTFPASLRKLEWNCQGEERDLWQHVLQFRPSGLRAKRYTSCPALVAMTTTQVPILGPKRRFLTRTEGLRLQGFPDEHQLPESRDNSFAALGNAVHVDVVKGIITSAFG